ncbi:RNA pseudouridylate synthase domain-containing protein 2-like [Asterias rubens]|uniref:RNA pseudouridylate synthase domain-containing protein 2-like n=1 Tax=Asterias rubens TaxID=7604 RepID=UPI001455426B|nr:RNA pseudouridylate synthase domain-containing protein 2-like [Asterias rubens]
MVQNAYFLRTLIGQAHSFNCKGLFAQRALTVFTTVNKKHHDEHVLWQWSKKCSGTTPCISKTSLTRSLSFDNSDSHIQKQQLEQAMEVELDIHEQAKMLKSDSDTAESSRTVDVVVTSEQECGSPVCRDQGVDPQPPQWDGSTQPDVPLTAEGGATADSARSYAEKRKWFGDQTKTKTKKGKKLDRHPKKIQKFANDEKFNETSYYFENGLRKVTPYVFVFEAHVKGRWMKRSVMDVFRNEFRSETPEYYQKAISSGLITIDGKKVSLDKILVNNEFLRSMVHRHEPPVTSQPLDLITVDEEYVVINKPASIPVHPCGKYRHNTIIFLLGKEYGFTGLHTIHRLDRLTSGLLMFARTREVSQRVDAYVRERKLTKTYVCKVVGEFPSDPLDCVQSIVIVSHKIGVCRVGPAGKECKTHFKRLSYDGHTSIVKCFPHTGRMHQIRVHLQYLGYPIVNDPLYNNPVWGPQLGKGGDIPHTTEQELLNELIKQHSAELESQVIQDPDDFVKSTRSRLVTSQKAQSKDIQSVNTSSLSSPDETGAGTKNTKASVANENRNSESQTKCDVDNEGSIVEQAEDTADQRCSSASVNDPNQTGVISEPQVDRDLSCQPTDGGAERPLEPEVSMKEEDRRQLVQDMCRECKLKLRDPTPEEMVMYLHALSYKGPDFEFTTPLPKWAEEHIQRTTAVTSPSD